MKKIIFLILIISLLFIPAFQVSAQNKDQTNEFDNIKIPGWAKDLRRIDIITFGVFPFSLFFVTFATDMVRWYKAGDKPFSDNRYAPWPIKSAGAVEMTTEEHIRTILIAAGVSVAIALLDFMIVKIKQRNERKRQESRAASSVEIERHKITVPDDEEAYTIKTEYPVYEYEFEYEDSELIENNFLQTNTGLE